MVKKKYTKDEVKVILNKFEKEIDDFMSDYKKLEKMNKTSK